MRRLVLHATILATVAFAAAARDQRPAQAVGCSQFWLTGYLATGYPTADGTPTTGQEWAIAAAHPRLPFGTRLAVPGVGVVRIADRGLLEVDDLDILVPSAADAYALTGWREACPR